MLQLWLFLSDLKYIRHGNWLLSDAERVMNIVGSASLARASGFGSVHDVPRLPNGFADVFQRYFVARTV
jgi:hypothetical protein